ncbi:MAG: hypothetical protein CL565_06560 [Alphaproteobacteria bacterium]|nr:hypothetical protein [Alphaproteobacteria bacterium]
MMSISPRLFAMILAFLGFTGFSIGDAVYKALSAHADFATNAFLGSAVGMICLILYGIPSGKLKGAIFIEKRNLHILRGIIVCFQFLLAVYTFSLLPLATAYSLIFCAPFLTAVLARLYLNETVSRVAVITIIIGLLGVLVVLRPGFNVMSIGYLTAIGTALFVAYMNVLARKIGPQKDHGFAFAFYALLFILLVAGGIALYQGGPIPLSLWPLYLLAGVTSVAGTILLPLSFTMAPASLLAPIHYIQIVWGVLLGWLLFGDIPDAWTITGITIIVGAGLFLIRHPSGKI